MRRTICAAVWALSSVAGAQSPTTVSERSYAQARAIVERGMTALGGTTNFQAITDIHYTSTAKVPEDGQSANPDTALYVRPVATDGIVDFAHGRTAIVRQTNYLGSAQRGSSTVTTDRRSFTTDLRSNAVYPLAAPAVAAM